MAARSSLHLAQPELSPWSRSHAKRLFDCACILFALPLLVPALLAVALAVRVTSRGPIFFLQKRIGGHGQAFTIFKFRTMIHNAGASQPAVTTKANQRFTSVGPFLRRWKLDELPQVLNVLLGEMSLVGPRPKLPEHVISEIPCRPGITGAASLAFAREELVFDRVPKESLESYYQSIVLPAKRDLDADYMGRATFTSDLKLIVDSVLRHWDSSLMESLLEREAFGIEEPGPSLRSFESAQSPRRWGGVLDLQTDSAGSSNAPRTRTM
ncbi:MAG TPA: sugar transferase [Terracidiphilus sp.]